MAKSTSLEELQSMSNMNIETDETIAEVLQKLGSQQMQPQQMQPQVAQPMYNSQYYPVTQQNPINIVDRFSMGIFWDKDALKALYIGIITTVVMIVPIEKFAYQYVNIENVPYSSIIIKAIIITILSYIVMKFD
jgi:hypothetical protein